MKKQILLFVFVCALPGLLSSCLRESAPEESVRAPKGVDFLVSMGEWQRDAATKGVPYGLSDKVENFAFGVSLYASPASGEGFSLFQTPVRVAYNESSKKWACDRPITWPDRGGTVRFYAFAPYAEGVMETPDEGAPLLHYQAPEDVEEQRGLLVSTTGPLPDYPEGGSASSVSFKFRHVLSAVVFCIGEDIPIESVGVSGVYDGGTYDMAADAWSDLTVTRPYVLDHPSVYRLEGFDVLDEKYILLLPPQLCPEGAVIHLVADGKQLDIPIAGHEWKQGFITTYILGRNDYEYTFEAIDPEEAGPDDEGSGDIDITSWRRGEDGELEPVEWYVEGYYGSREAAEAAEGKLPSCFVTAAVVTPPDGEGKSSLRLDYAPAEGRRQTLSLEEVINATLASNPEKGEASAPWNLSNPDGGDVIAESANTYIVSAPGYYRIPMVMGGGAVKDGGLFHAAYSEENFSDYLDAAILSPYLQSSSAQAGKPSSAFVVWQDSPLVDVVNRSTWKLSPVAGSDSPVSFDGTTYWMHFHIGAGAIRQGLAQLAVTDNLGVVMWSWLIWVTLPEETSESVFSSRNLGWVEKGTLHETCYDEETVYVRLEQKKIGGKYCVVRVHRGARTDRETVSEGYSPYYQFGRKDPLIPATVDGNVAMTGRYPVFADTRDAVAKSSVGRSVREPWLHLSYASSPYDWCVDEGRNNWWMTSSGGKTVYDPSPAGWRVPDSAELDALDGLDGSGGLKSLPACGRRNSREGQLVNVGKYRYYWSATGVDENSVRIFTDDPEMSGGLGRRSRGLSVRPVLND